MARSPRRADRSASSPGRSRSRAGAARRRPTPASRRCGGGRHADHDPERPAAVDQRPARLGARRVPLADQVLLSGVQGITDLITTPGLINLDFADVKSVMQGAGSALMGIGSPAARTARSRRPRRRSPRPCSRPAWTARTACCSHPGGSDLGLFEINEAARWCRRPPTPRPTSSSARHRRRARRRGAGHRHRRRLRRRRAGAQAERPRARPGVRRSQASAAHRADRPAVGAGASSSRSARTVPAGSRAARRRYGKALGYGSGTYGRQTTPRAASSAAARRRRT
jgi:hypothetical protein